MILEDVLQSPRLAVEKAIESMEDALEGKTIGKEYSSPFHNLIEAAVSLSKDSFIGSSNIIRKKFPILANNMEDLFYSIHDEVKDNLFAIGGTVPIAFYINILDLKQYGIREDGGYITNIPAGSTVTALATTFTLLNDITITLKDNNIVTVEQKESELDIAVNDIRLLSSVITTDDAGIEWILFETKVRNIVENIKIEPITHTNTLVSELALTYKFSTIEVGYEYNNVYTKLKISYSDEYLDETTATALVVIKDKSVVVTIPKIYLATNMVKGKIIITVYETEGDKTLDLSRLTVEDFTLNIENEGKDQYSATSKNIIISNASRGTLNNGIDSMTFEELKHAIINSTLGDIDLPITSNQLKRKAKMYGHDLRVTTDTLLKREFIASKPLPNAESKLIQCFPDIFFNKAGIILSDEEESRFVSKYTDLFIIHENAVYVVDKDGLIKLITDSEISYFENLSKSNKAKYLKDNKLFFSPLTYVVKYGSDTISSEVYYLKPKINNIRIMSTNPNVGEKVNTSKYDITKTSNGYLLRILPVLNEELKSTALRKLKARLHLPIRNSNSTVYFDSEYDINTGIFNFYINTGELSKGVFDITNGVSILKDLKVGLENNAMLYIYSTDENILDNSNFLLNEFGKIETKTIILTKELLNISLGIKLDYVYNNVLTIFTSKKYVRHTTTKYATYSEDIYRPYNNGLVIAPVLLNSGKVDLRMELLHEKGSPILDENGEQIVLYKANDLVLDDNGKPILDKVSGIKRVLDIMMLEYEFMVADSEPYQSYLEIAMNNILAMIDTDMNELNDITMDVTKIKYKTFRNIKDVPIIVNNIIYPVPYRIKPKVVLVLDKNNVISNGELIDEIKSICGKIITKYLNFEKITLEEIRAEIKKSLTIAVIGIKIIGIDPKDSEVVITSNDNRFTIDKVLALTETNNTIVKYDVSLELEYI